MKNPKNKTIPKDIYIPTEVGTLINGFRSEFRVFGEKLGSMSDKLDATYEQTARNTEKISLLETAVQRIAADVNALTGKVNTLTAQLTALTDNVSKNTNAIAALTASIDKLANVKLDREELHILENRVSALESKLAVISR